MVRRSTKKKTASTAKASNGTPARTDTEFEVSQSDLDTIRSLEQQLLTLKVQLANHRIAAADQEAQLMARIRKASEDYRTTVTVVGKKYEPEVGLGNWTYAADIGKFVKIPEQQPS